MDSFNYIGIHPFTRIVLFLLLGTGIFFVENPLYFIILYTIILLPLIIIQKAIKTHLYFIAFGMLPFYLSYIFLYRYITENMTWRELHFFTMRTMVIISLVQVIFTLVGEELIFSLKKWRIKNDTIILIISSVTLLEDIKRRSDIIINARFARGYISKRTWWNKIVQMPYILVPLIISILKTAELKAVNWQQRNIIELISSYQVSIKYSYFFNGLVIMISIIWMYLVISKNSI